MTVQAALHVELQVGPRWELRGVGQFVVLALPGRDRARACLGAARHNMRRPITSITGVDIVVRVSNSVQFRVQPNFMQRASSMTR